MQSASAFSPLWNDKKMNIRRYYTDNVAYSPDEWLWSLKQTDENMELYRRFRMRRMQGHYRRHFGWRMSATVAHQKDLTAYTRSDIDAWLRAGIIVDEYGEAVSADEIWELEETKKDGLDNRTYAERERKETGHYPTFTRPNFGQMYVDDLFFADRIEEWCWFVKLLVVF